MLTDLSAEELLHIVEDSMGSSPMPYLADQAVRQRALEIARNQGLFERIERELTPAGPVPILPYTRFRDYRRDGNRTRYQALLGWRGGQIGLAAMGCYLGLDYADYLQDLLWAECEATTWVVPAHEDPDRPVDLRAAGCGEQYAMIVTLLADQLADEVRRRVVSEVRRRVLDPFLQPQWEHWWKTTTNNWNAVCHACTCIAAMLLEEDAARLASILIQSLENLEAFVAGFTSDGGCTEGPSYWRYGFGHFAHLGAALHDFTGGRVRIMRGEKIERVCRYPLAVFVAPGQELEFADAHGGFLPVATATEINRLVRVPELFGLCEIGDGGWPLVRTLQDLLVYDGRQHAPWHGVRDDYLPDLGVVRIRNGPVTLGAKAGHNAEHHNHNDVGSFVVHRGRTFFLCDPGAPIYSRDTFSPRRYESVFCNSFGHSVPVVDGGRQSAGEQYAGTMSVERLNEEGDKAVRIELHAAYDVPALRRLSRTIELRDAGRAVTLADDFVFDQAPGELEEAFVTYLPADVLEGAAAVRIRSEADGVAELTAERTQGAFRVAELADESARECRHGGLLRRITFTPAARSDRMTLRFVLRWL